jgi:hypothetical protein
MFTVIVGTVTESNEILVDKDKIEIIFKQSQLTQKPKAAATLIGQQSETEYEEIYMLIINGVAFPFYEKEVRDKAYEELIK